MLHPEVQMFVDAARAYSASLRLCPCGKPIALAEQSLGLCTECRIVLLGLEA